MSAGFSAISKGAGGLAKNVGEGVVKANKYTMGKAGKIAKAGLGKAQDIGNKATGYEPNLKGPAPKVETDVYGNATLSTPKVVDPNSFAGRGGIKGAAKRVLTGDANAGTDRASKRSLLAPEDETETTPAAPAPTGRLARPSAGSYHPQNESKEFNPNWRNWKSMPSGRQK